MAKVLVSCDDWKHALVAPLTCELPVAVRPKLHVAEEKGIKSLDSKVETAIKFVNRSKQAIKVYWIDYEGNRQLRGTVPEEGSFDQKRTFLTHPWLVTDADGNPWSVHLPDAQPRTVEILGPASQAQPLQSKYKIGDMVPLLWEYRVTGARAGQEGAFVCTYAYQPFVAIYCRQVNAPVLRLLKKIDEATAKHSTPRYYKQRLGSYLVLVCDSKAREKELRALAEKEKIGHTILALGAMNEGTLADSWRSFNAGLGEAETTVLLSTPPRARIQASYAYRKGELNDKEIDRIIADLAKILPNTPAQEIAELPGPLVLAGGRHQDLPNNIRAAFFDLAGGQKARIVVIPTAVAHADDPKSADEFRKPWLDLKPLSVAVLHTRDRKTADDPAFVKPLTEATAVFFTNGHRDRILKAYRGTLVEKELKQLQARGGLIGGTGTGAAVLGDLVIDRANEDRLTEPGLGLLPGFLIEDGRAVERLPDAVAANPASAGLMLERDTAVVIRGKTMGVIGEGTVTVRLAKGAGQEAKTDTLKSGRQLDLVELRRAAAIRAKESQRK